VAKGIVMGAIMIQADANRQKGLASFGKLALENASRAVGECPPSAMPLPFPALLRFQQLALIVAPPANPR
jgi:hypothetical protein